MVSDFPPPDDPLVRLCADARLLLRYLDFAPIRVENAYRLEHALYSARDVSLTDERWQACVHALRTEVEVACERLEPIISMADLRAGRSPFDEKNGRVQPLTRLVLVAFAIAMTIFCVKSFMMTNEYVARARQINEIKAVKPVETIYKLRRQFDSGAVRDSQSTVSYEFQRSVDEIRRALDSYRDLLTFVMNDKFDDSFLLATIKKFISQPEAAKPQKDTPPYDEAASDPQGTASGNAQGPSPKAKSQSKQPDQISSNANTLSSDIACKKSFDSTEISLPATRVSSEYLQFLVAEAPCFAVQLGIPLDGFQELYIAKLDNHIKDQLYMMNMIQLPLIAGILGGLIYLIHFMIYRSHFPAKNSFDIIFNILTSGLFGILIGWVLSFVEMGGKSSEVISASPFGLAFLAGFSSDFFFQAIGKLAQGRKSAAKQE